MAKKLLWGGLVATIVFFLIGCLSTAAIEPEMTPLIPFLYNSNRVIWLFLFLISILVFWMGLLLMVIAKFREEQKGQLRRLK